ncbi:Subtilase family protein [Ceratocystis platani]|uniref:Subtilase family protein n=1 Tax=Ceratocystis fimbriata f. sp. platani TaxID=88771 RepID=A0A0F8BMY9_CERFI|nr:Subtilase family protein [Ceratocystis platani]
MTQVNKLHAKGYRGKGIKIAVIDSGIDYLHPDLGGCFGKGCLVTHGYDFIPSNYSIDGGPPIEFEWTRGDPDKYWENVQDWEIFPVGLDTSATSNGCLWEDYPQGIDLSKKVVLLRRGGCEFLKKAFIATFTRAKYVIMYNNAPGTADIDGLTGYLNSVSQLEAERTFLTFIPKGEVAPYRKLHHIPIDSKETWILPTPGTNKATHQVIDDTEMPGAEVNPRLRGAQVELPGFQVKLVAGSKYLRADLVPISKHLKSRTRKSLGVEIVGQHHRYPKDYANRGKFIEAFDGLLNDGTYAPPGEYKWLFRALKLGGNYKKAEDYDTCESVSFEITYEDRLIPQEVAAARMIEKKKEMTRPQLKEVMNPVNLGS